VYGHSLTSLPSGPGEPGRLLKYGGCRFGGYFGSSSGLQVLVLREETIPSSGRRMLRAVWEVPPVADSEVHGFGPRAYHSATPLPSDPALVGQSMTGGVMM
jgi:hypothetical protein